MTPSPASPQPSSARALPAVVTVEAPARLHFGMLDLRGDRGRRFGGIGAAVPKPATKIEIRHASGRTAEGPERGRALAMAERFARAMELAGGFHLEVRSVIPSHVGLGSGTQLALSVARGLSELYGLETDAGTLSEMVGRGARSAIGTWLFERGGFVLEGGRKPGTSAVAPLLVRLPMPESWRCVLAIPPGAPGLSGEMEMQAFEQLPPPPAGEVERMAHVVLMQLLPAVVEADLDAFGSGLTELQRVTGGWFGAAQGGAFARGNPGELVRRMETWGAKGVGQSSWGPAVYGLVEGNAEAEALAERVGAFLQGEGMVLATEFSNHGALVTARRSPD